MSGCSPGPSSAVKLALEKRKNLDFCIICQHDKDSQGNQKVYDTFERQETISKTSDYPSGLSFIRAVN